MKDYDFIKNKVHSLLTEKRFNHCIRVEKEATKLGDIYGVDNYKCRLAAIAHDCTKKFSDDELTYRAREYGIEIDDIQLETPQLLHGPVGAEYCRREFEIQDKDILNSIYYHTTGRKNMSMLEKIIYLSDIIEEGRYFQGIEKIRDMAIKDIDMAIILSCNSTISYVMQKNFLIHPLTIDLRNSLLMKGGK